MTLEKCMRLAGEFSLTDKDTVEAMRSRILPRLWVHYKVCQQLACKIPEDPWWSDRADARIAVRKAVQRLRQVELTV